MTLHSNNNSVLSLRSSNLSNLNGLSRHSAFRSNPKLPVWQSTSFSLTGLVIADLNLKLNGRLTPAQLSELDQRLDLYFSVQRDEKSLSQDLEQQLVELECQARQVEFKLHITGALFSWAGFMWVDEWPEVMGPDHLYFRVSDTKNLLFKSHGMLEPIEILIPEGISESQQQDYRDRKSDPTLLEALQTFRNAHIESIVLNRAELEALIDAQVEKILASFNDTTEAHASATPIAERDRRSSLLEKRLQASRQELLTQLLDMPAANRLVYLSEIELVSQQIDAERVECAMQYGNHEAAVNDMEQAVIRSPHVGQRCPKDKLKEAAGRLAKERIDLRRFDHGQTILDKVIALKDSHGIEIVLAYADHMDSPIPAVPAAPAASVDTADEVPGPLPPFSPCTSTKEESPLFGQLLPNDHLGKGLSIVTLGLGANGSVLEETKAEEAPEAEPGPPFKPWLIACALQGSNFDGALRELAQHGCLFDPLLMQQVGDVSAKAHQDFVQTKLNGSLGGESSPCGLAISEEGSVGSFDSSVAIAALPKVDIAQLLDDQYALKSEHLAKLIYPAQESLSEAFANELMRRYQPPVGWPNDIWQAIQARQAYNVRETEHFEILTQHCHKSLAYLTRQYLAHSGAHSQVWYEQKLKTELAIIHSAYRGQSHVSDPVDIHALLSANACIRARKGCIPSKTLSLVPRSSPSTISAIGTFEQPASIEDAKDLLQSLKLSVDERQRQAQKYCLAKHVFKRTLRYLEHTEVDKSDKKDALLGLCSRFAKGEIHDVDGLMSELTRPGSPARVALHTRCDKLDKPARSFSLIEYDLQKRGALLGQETLFQPAQAI